MERSKNKVVKKSRGIWLLGPTHESITGSKLPSIRQVLGRFFHLHIHDKLTIHQSATSASVELLQFWERARIPTIEQHHVAEKITTMHLKWQRLKKSRGRQTPKQLENETLYINSLENLFDVAHRDALKIMTIAEDKDFLLAQRENGRRGSMGQIDKKLWKKEKNIKQRQEKVELRKIKERKRKLQSNAKASVTEISKITGSSDESDKGSDSDHTDEFVIPDKKRLKKSKKTSDSKSILTPEVTSALDRTKTSNRNASYILTSLSKAMGKTDNVPSRESIRVIRRQNREKIAKEIKTSFAPTVPLVIHWDGKMLRSLTSKKKVDRLAVVVSGNDVMKLLGVPSLTNSTGASQASAVFELLTDWNICDRVCFMSFDTTASNTGKYNGACALLEKMLDRKLISLACRHHIFELIASSVFNQLFGASSGPNIKFFERFSDSWSNINHNIWESGMEDAKISLRLELVRDELIQFKKQQLLFSSHAMTTTNFFVSD